MSAHSFSGRNKCLSTLFSGRVNCPTPHFKDGQMSGGQMSGVGGKCPTLWLAWSVASYRLGLGKIFIKFYICNNTKYLFIMQRSSVVTNLVSLILCFFFNSLLFCFFFVVRTSDNK